MKKTKIMQRILSMLLAFSMLLVYYPVAVGAETSSAGAGGGYEKVVDAQKLDGWKEFFGPDILSTQNAGGVWTDKSVFTDASAFPAGTIEMSDPNSFIVALSAIASNKEIVGYATIPTDTMLVLDLSGSMDWQVSTLVSAANDAIRQLYDTNRNNRVGVILYSGNEEFGTSTYAQGARVNGEFEFVLYDENGTEKEKVKNERGAFKFGTLEFDRAGVYVYTVEEVNGNLGGITYDKTVYTVRINVIDDGTGKLRVEKSYEKDGVEATGIVFRNAYSLKSYSFNIERTAIIGGCKSC